MIVEDEESLALMLRYNLEAEGYAVDTVERGDEAEIRLRENIPDLLLLDWMLPGISGIELCRRLRSREQTRSLPRVQVVVGQQGLQQVVRLTDFAQRRARHCSQHAARHHEPRLSCLGEAHGGVLGELRRLSVDEDDDRVAVLRKGLGEGDLPLAPADLGREQLGGVAGHPEMADDVDERQRAQRHGGQQHQPPLLAALADDGGDGDRESGTGGRGHGRRHGSDSRYIALHG